MMNAYLLEQRTKTIGDSEQKRAEADAKIKQHRCK